ncbi:hypothetical protein [Kitasatospora sp. HPMI-4]|uniref:hypothetical protein n=1 Tax=Kitasatospora sp. HPMI-4 TaxID=3448443 RepID=UPI003F1BB664
MVTFDRFLAMGLALPRTTERLTWGTEVTLRVGEKIFAMGTPDSGSVCCGALHRPVRLGASESRHSGPG